ncbi:MAG: hypothetical protein K2M96_04680 [Prevotella sp.]|nr:hypothetical protein [Prevotella sp.]
MNIINNNPYRQLGVYSTSSQRDVIANQGKMKAFLRVGSQVSFPLDLNGLLPEISRTEQSVADATSKLTLPAEQLKYAQFWFAKCTQLDEIAFGKLINGDFDGAINIWNKKVTASSLQNLLVCALMKNQLGDAINYAQSLYNSYGNKFVEIVLGENALATSENLAHDFLNVLCEEFKPDQFVGFITNEEWKEYVGSKSIKPLVDKILTDIDVCKSSKGEGATARLNAGTKLMNNTKNNLAQLKQYVSTTDIQYQMIADKLGLEILQCGIDYYNDSEEPDAARKAMVLQKYAQSVVIGKMAKDRCKENVDILTKIIAQLPPSQVFAEDKAIKAELRKYSNLPDKISHAVTLLNSTKPHLLSIKNKLGASNSYYLKISTQIVGNALHNVIEEVNALQNDSTFQLNMIINKTLALSSLQSVLRSAWNATKIMDSFDMESDFKNNRYNENRKTLSNMCRQVGVSTYSSTSSYSSTSRSYSSINSSSRASTSYSSSSSSDSSDDTNWGCILVAIVVFVIFCIIASSK